ncbi:MAG: 3-oxoacyl-[acyl-carrier-protein] reductase [Planctomycetales bacterium]|nr:3-oxoacyl-[acyl-carrier-protein] reductase [Planctomycetales bacterium]
MSTDQSPQIDDYTIPNLSLEGKVALVTGGSRGIGKAISLALAAQGANVAINCNTGGELAQGVRHEILELGREAQVYAHDVGNETEVARMHDEILTDFGHVDILVNNAGITRDKSFKKMTREMWDAVINVDLTGVFLVTKQFIDPMAEKRWGRVVNIASVIGEIGNFGQTNYAAAKGGLIAFSKSLAREYARKGITVNVVAPGFIKTDMTDAVPAEGLKLVTDATPVGRLGLPYEVAAGVAFLTTEAASYITGHVLDINGGYAM